MFSFYIHILPLLVGWFATRLIGNEQPLAKLTDLLKRFILSIEKKLNKGEHRKQKGALLAFGIILLASIVTQQALFFAYRLNIWLGVAIASLAVFYCLNADRKNLSLGVVAPLFWFTFFGIPGMVAYKVLYTLQATIDGKSNRYREFGYWTNQISIVANYIPENLTPFLIQLVKKGQQDKQSANTNDPQYIHSINEKTEILMVLLVMIIKLVL